MRVSAVDEIRTRSKTLARSRARPLTLLPHSTVYFEPRAVTVQVQTAPCQVAPQYVRWQAGAREAVSEPEPQSGFEPETSALPWPRSTAGAIVTCNAERVITPWKHPPLARPRGNYRVPLALRLHCEPPTGFEPITCALQERRSA